MDELQLDVVEPTTMTPISKVWQPPPQLVYKLNFDATIFTNLNCSRFGATIRNDRGEVMAAMSVKGPPITNNEEAKALACRKALEFSIDVSFSELIIEGDNANVMRVVCSFAFEPLFVGSHYQRCKMSYERFAICIHQQY